MSTLCGAMLVSVMRPGLRGRASNGRAVWRCSDRNRSRVGQARTSLVEPAAGGGAGSLDEERAVAEVGRGRPTAGTAAGGRGCRRARRSGRPRGSRRCSMSSVRACSALDSGVAGGVVERAGIAGRAARRRRRRRARRHGRRRRCRRCRRRRGHGPSIRTDGNTAGMAALASIASTASPSESSTSWPLRTSVVTTCSGIGGVLEPIEREVLADQPAKRAVRAQRRCPPEGGGAQAGGLEREHVAAAKTGPDRCEAVERGRRSVPWPAT